MAGQSSLGGKERKTYREKGGDFRVTRPRAHGSDNDHYYSTLRQRSVDRGASVPADENLNFTGTVKEFYSLESRVPRGLFSPFRSHEVFVTIRGRGRGRLMCPKGSPLVHSDCSNRKEQYQESDRLFPAH